MRQEPSIVTSVVLSILGAMVATITWVRGERPRPSLEATLWNRIIRR